MALATLRLVGSPAYPGPMPKTCITLSWVFSGGMYFPCHDRGFACLL